MRQFCARSNSDIYLGREGEHKATQVIFNISGMIKKFGEGTVSLVAKRANDTVPYPCVVERSGNQVIWTVTSADTAQAGKGYCELRYVVGETVAKSDTYKTIVIDALDEPGDEVPEAYQGYVDQVLQAGSDAQLAAKQAKESASHYPFIQDDTWWVWDVEKGIFVDTGVKAVGKEGPSGKNAYEYAQEGGFTGTVEEFSVKLAELLLNADKLLIDASADETE